MEFGATNGVDLSNTWLLEKGFGWSGVLAERAYKWHRDLRANRLVSIETDCVWKVSGEILQVNMTAQGEFSTIGSFNSTDSRSAVRRNGERYEVATISLLDLLKQHRTPRHVGYLSIDAEGSEYDILNAFDFSEFQIDIITIEHNYMDARVKIHELFTSKGYHREFEGLSKWDDWYVLR